MIGRTPPGGMGLLRENTSNVQSGISCGSSSQAWRMSRNACAVTSKCAVEDLQGQWRQRRKWVKHPPIPLALEGGGRRIKTRGTPWLLRWASLTIDLGLQ
eukprot:1661919-Pyramimonas_sp.AAC.1